MMGSADLSRAADASRLVLSGDWTLAHYRPLAGRVAALRGQIEAGTQVDAAALGALDTAGVALLHELLGAERLQRLAGAGSPLGAERRALLATVSDALATEPSPPAGSGHALGDVLEHVGQTMTTFWSHVVGIAGFIGITLETAFAVLLRPRRWRVTSLVANLERTALDAVPIVALLTFLVGAVVAFLGATVLAAFGASIFTVDLIAYSFLREFGVLLTAIIVAGRTASSFTAQIGSMRANEEVDAIRVLGLDPVELLVLPRVAALLLALPMLTFVAMISGIVGGMLVCATKLDISPVMFLSVIENNVGLNHFLVGMAKAPIFAFLIGVIGCLEGFRVSGSAQSVGEHTTSAVVQSIFTVIVVDAVAALFCMEMGW
ncbi:ABC transporter permease [Thauera linaloolentis]|uniref:Putative ABC transporter permease n=1 Tax=Thauera linaloolentis (strain DSM 12138 / JCM 21573 / CCUG 41526 / CIP 105981 / IAM 15112 / NBRC 102519 / 47Lol) TaxID=1123367 RepID=N6YV44_THAL4|nr:ABC transporter permease [Thauera linaloolentis]ENO86018.1 putative ABC transporter permease [Thauera linaloolentis 47Lol = DSM 12138]MCM8567394.1 ABC transporter permease [Thauera linaloolentis]